jgi:hypothetical protein
MRGARTKRVWRAMAGSAVVLLALSASAAAGARSTQSTLRLSATPSIVKPGRKVTVRLTGSKQACTVAVIRSGRLFKVWTTKPHAAKTKFRTGSRTGALTVSAKCGRQTRIAPVWVVSHIGSTVVLGYQPTIGYDAGGPIVATSIATTANARRAVAPVSVGLLENALSRVAAHASAAESVSSVRSSIVSIAESRDQNAAWFTSDSYCNPYSSAMHNNETSAGCPAGEYSEEWCADFAAWVWRQAGVSFIYSTSDSNIDAYASSFYGWGLATGNWHPLSSGYQPQPGDVALYGSAQAGAGDHVGIVVGGTANDPTVVNGDWAYPDFSDVYEVSDEMNTRRNGSGAPLTGYISVPTASSGTGGTSPGGATGPSSGGPSGSGYEMAFQANTGSLIDFGPGGDSNTGQGMMTGTSPSIAALPGGGYEMAFQANTGNLIVYGAGGDINTGQGMKAGTSPSIAASPQGGFQVAFQANTGNLYIYNSKTGPANLQQGMDNTTSPSITALSSGGYEMAFQANTGDLYSDGTAGGQNWQQGMMAGTSPSITALSSGGYEMAFQANTGNLYSDGTGGGGNWQQGMMAGTSPSITP